MRLARILIVHVNDARDRFHSTAAPSITSKVASTKELLDSVVESS
jgi:hypothetical protein